MEDENLDETDFGIICHFCRGIKSYSDVANNMRISRNTVYRRVKKLEEMGILNKKIYSMPDFEEIGYNFVLFGIDIELADIDYVINILKKKKSICLLWKTWGDHDIVVVSLCEKGKEGDYVNSIREELNKENIEIPRIDVSSSINCEKFNFDIFKEFVGD